MDEPDDFSFDDLEDLIIDEQDVPSEEEDSAGNPFSTPAPAVHSQQSAPVNSQLSQQSTVVASSRGAPREPHVPGDQEPGAVLVDQEPTAAPVAELSAASRKRALDQLLQMEDYAVQDWAPQVEKRRLLEEQAAARRQLEDQIADDVMKRIRLSRINNASGQNINSSHSTEHSTCNGGVKIHTTLPSGVDFQKLTFSDGRRLYLTVRKKQSAISEESIRPKSGLLGVSFEQLKAQAALVTAARVRRQHEQSVLDKLDSWQLKPAAKQQQHQLWASTFHPSCYTELISDEALNRGLLRWIKLWDKLVFGVDVIKVKQDKKPQQKFPAKGKPFVRKPAFEVIEELDSGNRPSQRAALLCGPPGLGKTTLAHVLARHAGYNVVELNASDDRSVEAFRTALENSTQMRSLVGQQPRPNCLVIDEIDGAPAPTINYLVSVLAAKEASANPAVSAGKKKKRRGPVPINRPIICICNELYTPSLRPLRQAALVLPFNAVSPERLSGRLLEICRLKHLETDLSALLCLCQRTSNDIRACLGFLQFVRSRNSSLNVRQVQSSSVGQKDHHQSLLTAWKQVFTISSQNRVVFNTAQNSEEDVSVELPLKQKTLSPLQSRFQNICATLASCGEYDKLMQGIFENYLSAQSKEANIHTLCSALDWMCFSDVISAEIFSSQSFILLPYQMFAGVALHMFLASHRRCKITFPQTEYEASQRRARVQHVIAGVRGEMSPILRCYNTADRGLVLDILPLLPLLIQPSLRPVSCQLYSSREDAELRRVVNIMIDYSLTYRQQQTEDGQYHLLLDPDIDLVAQLSDESSEKQSRPLQYTVKQLIARETELERVRRSEKAKHGLSVARNDAAVTKSASSSSPAVPHRLPTSTADKPVPKPLPAEPERAEPRDFFGRVIARPAEHSSSRSAPDASDIASQLLKTDIWFHFKEGYNNAVRRSVRVRDLL